MKIVIDSSVAVKIAVPEIGQVEAHELLRTTSERIAPSVLMLEAANTIWKKVQRKELSTEQALAGLEVIEDSVTRFVEDRTHAHRALSLSLQLAHPVYDCAFLAVAELEDVPLVTAGVKLANKLKATPFGRLVRPLMQIS